MKKILLITCFVFIFWPLQLMAHEWQIDPAHSEIRFEIKHIYSTVSGRFSDFSGDMFFNPAQLDKSKFDFTVKVDSIDTYIEKRDNHLRSPDFFDAGKYPLMSFKTNRVTYKGGNRYALEGKLTVKDVSKDIVVEFIYWGQKQNPFNKDMIVSGFDSHFSIDRLDFHVGNGKFFKMGVVGKEVSITITLEATRKK